MHPPLRLAVTCLMLLLILLLHASSLGDIWVINGQSPVTRITRTSPLSGESRVSLSRETIIDFSGPLAPGEVEPWSVVVTYGGEVLPTRLHLSPDRRRLTIFYVRHLPASAVIRVEVFGDLLLDASNRPIDADGNGQPGGIRMFDFETLSLTTLPGTTVFGRVFASELAPAENGQPGVFVNRPLPGVRIFVDGLEDRVFTYTDEDGDFRLEDCPVGDFFVYIDGRTVAFASEGRPTAFPEGPFYPFVGKKWTGLPQQETSIGEIYLPLIEEGTLKPVSATQVTPITFPPSVLAENPELADVVLMVPPNSLYADNGQRGGRVGIAAVPPDRLPEPLPPGFNFPIVITVQTDGPTNFDVPVPICFPNIDNPDTPENEQLPPGAKSALWSFDHDIGDWVIQGSMTVSPDGLLVCTDPGVGINEPGWHGEDPGTQGEGAGGGPDGCDALCCPDDIDPDDITAQFRAFQKARVRCVAGVAGQAAHAYAGFVKRSFLGFRSGASALNKAADTRDKCNDELPDCFPTGSGSGGGPGSEHDPTGLEPKVDELEAAVEGMMDVLEELADVVDELEDAIGDAESMEDLPPATQQDVEDLLDELNDRMQDSGFQERWNNAVDRHTRATDELARDILLLLPEDFFFWIYDEEGDTVARGKGRSTRMPTVILPSNEFLIIERYFPLSNNFSAMPFRSGDNGSITLISGGMTMVDESPDTDGDGLSDAAEAAIGTSPTDPDTDGDGVSDGAEVAAGTDPLDGFPARTGIIGSVLTDGTAVDVVALDGLAAVADGEAGITVFNVFNGMRPLRVAQVDTRGFARRVAMRRNRVLVADGIGGAALIDTTDPPASFIIREYGDGTLSGAGMAVCMNGPFGFIGTSSGRIVVIELGRGDLITARSGLGNIRDIGFERDTLYVLSDGLLTALSFDMTGLGFLGSVSVPGLPPDAVHSWRLTAGEGALFASRAQGFNYFTLASPGSPNLALQNTTAQLGWKHVVPNGSGLAFVALSPNASSDGPHHVSLYDIRDVPDESASFITTFPTPGLAAAVGVYNGLGYVADSGAGLQVVNYLAADVGDIPPTIELSANFSLSPAEVEENKLVRVTAHVTDDVQVRNVEFWRDGVRVLSDGGFPFEYRFITPRLSRGSFTLRARAFDTGGNFTWTDEIVVTILPDTTPPVVLATLPRDGGKATPDRAILAIFNEPMASVPAGTSPISLTYYGPDGILGTEDDVPVDGVFAFLLDPAVASFVPAAPLALGHYRATVSGAVTDVAGNALGSDHNWDFRVMLNPDLVADFPLNGDGSDLSEYNNPLTIGDVTFVADRLNEPGMALRLDGTAGSNAVALNIPEYEISEEGLTIVAWVRPRTSTPSTFENIVMKGSNSYGLQLGDGTFHFLLQGASTSRLSANVPIYGEEWVMIAGTWDGYVQRIHIDSVQAASKPYSNVLNVTDQPLSIGRAEGGGTFAFDGDVDEVRVYTRALTAAELFELYGEGAPANALVTGRHSYSLAASYLNAHMPVLDGEQNAYSLPASYLNAFMPDIPGDKNAFSSPASYLNAFMPEIGGAKDAISAAASYLNASESLLDIDSLSFSPVVSYENESEP